MSGPSKPANEVTVDLGSDIRIGRAGEVFALFESAASSADMVVIDGTEVSKIDAAGLQALTAAIVRLNTAGTRWRWHNKSIALAGAAKMLGLGEALNLL